MPRAVRVRAMREQVPPAIRFYFSTGRVPRPDTPEAAGVWELYSLGWPFSEGHRRAWARYREQILEAWEGPGRPWAETHLGVPS